MEAHSKLKLLLIVVPLVISMILILRTLETLLFMNLSTLNSYTLLTAPHQSQVALLMPLISRSTLVAIGKHEPSSLLTWVGMKSYLGNLGSESTIHISIGKKTF
jgi:CHASE2 domain-containing sensor protein